VLPIKEAEEELTDCSQRFVGEAAVDGDHTTDMTTTETINRQGSKGFKCSSISGPRHAETTLGKAVPPASEPCLALCHSKQEAEVHRVLLDQVDNRDGSAQKPSKAQKIETRWVIFLEFTAFIKVTKVQNLLVYL